MHKRFVPTVAFVPKEYSIRDGDLYSRITKTMFDPLEQACDAPTIFFSLGEAGYIRIPRYMLTFTEEQKKAYRDASVADEDAPMVGAALQN